MILGILTRKDPGMTDSIQDAWAQCVDRHFAFLALHGFRMAPDLGYSRWYCTRVVYASETSAVAVDRNVEYQRAEVALARLCGENMPPVRVFVTGEPFYEVLLDNLLETRAPDLPRWKTVPGRTYEEQLVYWAHTLRTVAPDFLAGDLSAIDDGERGVRDRMDGKQQEVTVWLPQDATGQHEEHALRRHRAEVPPEVDVVVTRYRSSPARDDH
jgi:hypothetical protein